MDKQAIKRNLVKGVLAPLLRWRPLGAPAEGFSIILGVPWALRHLLEVNLRFVAMTDLRELDRVIVVFDRVHQNGGEAFSEAVRAKFPKLPLEFHFHPSLAGMIVGRVNQSKFYASLNWVTGLKHCRTRYAVLHDFDLYPTRPDLFTAIAGAMRERDWRFSGAEHTHFDGLTNTDALIGTWELGIDVQWLREQFRPIDCFHAICPINGRRVDVDAFSAIQSRTPQRGLAGTVGRDSYAHVTNLCSTFLRYSKGERVQMAWRLHYLWYLESLVSGEGRLESVIAAMRSASSAKLEVDGYAMDFASTCVTCSNVLRSDLVRMEEALHGACRPVVGRYIDVFAEFLGRFGDTRALAGTAAKEARQERSGGLAFQKP